MSSIPEVQNQSTNVGIYHYQIAAYAFLKHFFLPKYRYNGNQKNVMIFFSAHIGDVVMFLDTLKRYQNYYSKANGYHLVFACRNEVWAFLEMLGLSLIMPIVQGESNKRCVKIQI